MSKLPIENVSIKIKRKKTPVWPFATRDLCEQVVKLLTEDDLVRELSPPDEWRIHPSTEARGKGFQHERKMWVKNDLNAWHIAKLRQHAQDPTKQAGRTGFEGGFVSHLNCSFAELLRRLIRGRGRSAGKASCDAAAAPGSQGPKGKSPNVSPGPSPGDGGGRPSACTTSEPHGISGAAALDSSSAPRQTNGEGSWKQDQWKGTGSSKNDQEAGSSRKQQEGGGSRKKQEVGSSSKQQEAGGSRWQQDEGRSSRWKQDDGRSKKQQAAGSSSKQQEQELDSWDNYGNCIWIDDPDASPLPDSPDLIPDSEPGSSTSASEGETSGCEEDLASVPSTVQICPSVPGSPGEGQDSPVLSPGGTWRNLDGSWSLRNFDYGSDDEPPSEPPRGYRMPPISELRRRAAGYMGREVVTREPPEHFNVENWIAATRELRGNRTPSPDSSPPPPVRSPGGTWRHTDGRWHPRNIYPEPEDKPAKRPRLHLR